MTKEEREEALPCDTLKLDGMLEDAYEHGYDQARHDFETQPCEDAISRQAVLNQIFYSTDNSGDVVLGSTLRHRIENLPPVTPKQRWIPVSEILPEKDGEYLLWGKVIEDEENNIFIGDYDSCAEAFGYWQNYYDPSTLGYVDGELEKYASVIAWMPLPKPYKEGEIE